MMCTAEITCRQGAGFEGAEPDCGSQQELEQGLDLLDSRAPKLCANMAIEVT
jgi:hypothetical protein